MRKGILIILFIISVISIDNSFGQNNDDKKYSFNYLKNAENLSGYIDDKVGLLMTFDFYNRDDKIGRGGGWLIYKNGTYRASELCNELYSKYRLKGIVFIKDLFQVKNRNEKVDSTMLKDFDIYLYVINPQYLDKIINIDGEGAGKTYSYYEKYPLSIDVFKRTAGCNYFIKIDTYDVENEEEYLETLKEISDFMKKTAIESNFVQSKAN